MAKKKDVNFFVVLSNGNEIQCSQLDFNNIKENITNGRVNGWYAQRGKTFGDRHDFKFQYKYVAYVYADGDTGAIKARAPETVDVNKRIPPEPGARDKVKPADNTCVHNWEDPNSYTYVTQAVNGINRYYKKCGKCGAKSQLIKRREVEIAMEANGQTLEDVTLIKG